MDDSYLPDHGPVDAAQSRLDESVPVLSARETQFIGFAMLLYSEMAENIEHRSCLHIITERAYDLVKHAVLSIGPADLDVLTTEECVQRVPDMTKWEAE